jgi:esterase
VLLPDARNHGHSPRDQRHTYRELAADLRAFINERQLDDVILVGHSMGARTILLLCLADPHIGVAAAVSVDASPVHPTPDEGVRRLEIFFKGLQAIDLSRIDANLTLSKARAAVDEMLRKRDEGFSVVTRQWMVQSLTKNNGRFDWKFNLPVLAENLSSELTLVPERQSWQPFDKPFLFAGAAMSGYLSEERHADILPWFPRARFDYVADAGHYIHVDNPDGLLRLMLPFLKEVGGGNDNKIS